MEIKMKHESHWPKETIHCDGCGKKGVRAGILGLPDSWLAFSNSLYGNPWEVEVCSWGCYRNARMLAVQRAQQKMEAQALDKS